MHRLTAPPARGAPAGRYTHSEFVTAENILDLFTKHGVPEVTAEDVEAAAGACADGDACGGGWSFDMLSTDIDFNDYWVLQRVLESKRCVSRLLLCWAPSCRAIA